MLAWRPSDLSQVACIAEVSDHSNIKVSTPKEMLQRLQIALAQLKAENLSKNVQKEIR